MPWRTTATLLVLVLAMPTLGCMHRRAHRAEMHEQMQQHMQEMAAHDAKLELLVERMNATSGAEREEAMAAVINELVSQHRDMHRAMREHHQEQSR